MDDGGYDAWFRLELGLKLDSAVLVLSRAAAERERDVHGGGDSPGSLSLDPRWKTERAGRERRGELVDFGAPFIGGERRKGTREIGNGYRKAVGRFLCGRFDLGGAVSYLG
ncbi:hypothetical protein E2562_027278 [Oryza meyeriana var. granulata]|uniref:Uncharacterized protein n=1 Tax=Oryza meyeriana var. granulata TaxID=110450 RepID=A0A6G1CAV0_9ORYZ|nr:hypothetical protein E2562_027278 [Oryza meyeriana var. granulata]